MSGHNLPRVLRLREYEKLPYEYLSEEELGRLEKATADLGLPVFRFFRKHAQARQYVGMVQVGERTVQILPKIYDRGSEGPPDDPNLTFLVFLLSYTRRLPLRDAGLANYADLGGSFLEVWIRYFATELNRLLRRHLMHRYVEVEERASFLRGKLLVERELSGTEKVYARYACRYELFTPDHTLNRVLKFCNALLLRQSRVSGNRRLLQENDAVLADVSNWTVTAQDVGRIHLDRLNRHYEPILGLCKLLLENSTLDLRTGRITQLAFVFDMNRLFEEFVAEFLKRHTTKIRVGEEERHLDKVGYQKRIGRLFGEFNMEVDLVLTDDAKRSFILDTKYKILDAAERHGRLSQADFYQMYAYGSAGKRPYSDIVLLYPTSETAVRRTFHQKEQNLRLHVRQFDPRNIYDPREKRLNTGEMINQLNAAFSDVQAPA